MKKTISTFVLLIASVGAFAQDDRTLDLSQVPTEAVTPQGFAAKGWKLEKAVRGDLNGDAVPDYAVSLIEDIPFDKNNPPGPDRNRVLLVALKDGTQLKRVGVATKLLQCTSCGGAFYGVMDAPAHVSIAKGVIVVSQDHGSREVSESTFRFRYEKGVGRVVLIGYDYDYRDRAIGEVAKESTNYATGLRVTTTGKGKRLKTKSSKIKPSKIYLDDIDADEIEYAAAERLGLG